MLKAELLQNFKRIYILLPKTQKKSFLLFMLFSILTSIVQSFGVVSILPFVSAIADFDALLDNSIILNLYNFLNIQSESQFIIVLAVLFVLLLLLSNLFLLISIYMKLKIVRDLDRVLSRKLFSAYLYYDYEKLLNLESNEFAKNVLNETQNFTHRFLMAFFEIVVYSLMCLSIIILLLIVDPITSILMIFMLVIFYGLINSLLRRKIRSFGKKRGVSTQKRFKIVDEVLKTIKLVKIHHLENRFIEKFDNQTTEINYYQMMMGLMQQSPYYLMDIVLIVSLFLIVFVYSIQGLSFIEFVPKLSFFALAAYKLKPFVNKLYHGFVDLVFYQDSSEKLIQVMEDYRTQVNHDIKNFDSLESIELKEINFSYLNTSFNQLKDINININQNQIIGLTGKTGSGKTTLIHVLMGLLKANSGFMMINHEVIDETLLYTYQEKIAYVPQDVSLLDNSIKMNIAYGLNEDEIDLDKLYLASKLACLDSFVLSLDNQYETSVGDNGVKLSGGQRQRIGLARAFYRNPQFLILDEATNALDYQTETQVLNQLREHHPNCMILMISHRIESLNRCDYIYLLKDGEVIDEGSYTKLAHNNPYFISILEDRKTKEDEHA
jgi:ABC-type multidrug transport system fused ATPase/permease subunit